MEERIIPQHIAIIMDGNGRWAKKRGLPRTAGHKQGAETIRKIAIACNDLGVKALTCYAFSTENWKRPEDEVDYLCKLPKMFFNRYIKSQKYSCNIYRRTGAFSKRNTESYSGCGGTNKYEYRIKSVYRY